MMPPRAPQETALPPANRTQTAAPSPEPVEAVSTASTTQAAAPPLLTRLIGGAETAPASPAPAEARGAWRLALVGLVFLLSFGAVGVRMSVLATSEPSEPRVASTAVKTIVSRAPITDRNGRSLALNLPAWSIYAHPREMDDPERAAQRLAAALPSLDAERLARRFERSRGFAWIKRPVTPDERQAVHDLGIPGVYFGNREVRVYPPGGLPPTCSAA
jgi:cell division protein FtsI (penicillin-binding protein 3)